MGELARAVLRPGDWVRFDGGEHQVVAVAGTAIRLRSTTGEEQVVLAGYLMATPEFAVVDGETSPSVEPFGLLAGWQSRPHDALRDPYFPRRPISPNDKYAALVAAAGYLPLTLSGEDYLELLPVAWRAINDYGIRIDYRTYDSPALGPWRRQHSGVTAKRGLWEVHTDPLSRRRDKGSYADLGVILMFASSGRSGPAKVGITQAADLASRWHQ